MQESVFIPYIPYLYLIYPVYLKYTLYIPYKVLMFDTISFLLD